MTTWALAVLALAACGSEGEDMDGADLAASVAGRTFLSVQVSEDGAQRDLVEGSRLRLEFAAASLGAQAGCNTLSGGFSMDGDVLVVGELAQTTMGCERPLMEQDQWLSTFLGSRPRVGLAGDTLTMRAGATTIVLRDREVADPDRELVGTTWTLDGLVSGSTAASVPAGVSARVLIDAGGRMSVSAGCNQGSASVTVAADTLTIDALAMTRIACPPPADEVERAVLAVLQGRVAYTVEADALTLSRGEDRLTFRAD